MKEVILNAVERTKQRGKFKESGYVRGVIYGDGIETTSLKFEESALKKTLSYHGPHAKVWVKYGENKKFGFIKEVQRYPVTNKLLHVDVQIVDRDHEIKMEVPIIFHGQDNLERNSLLLQVNKHEVEVLGKMAEVPEEVVLDVAERKLGDAIHLSDLNLGTGFKILDDDDQIYGTITHLGTLATEEDEEETTAEEINVEVPLVGEEPKAE